MKETEKRSSVLHKIVRITDTGRKINKKKGEIALSPVPYLSLRQLHSARMLSTGRFFAITYTGRKVATTDVSTAMPSITSHDTGPKTNIDAPSAAAIWLLRIGHIAKHAIIASAKQISVIIEDSA